MGSVATSVGGALLGGIAGSQEDKVSQSQGSGVTLQEMGGFERQSGRVQAGAFNNLRNLLNLQNRGAGRDVSRARGAQNEFATMLQQYAQQGGLPQQTDINMAQGLAGQLFNPQQMALQQSFEQQRMMANRQAGISGRMSNDPVMLNKLAQDQTRQQGLLSAQQGAYGTQLAMNLPQQRMQAMQQYVGLREGLASQALQNRQTLLSLGSQLKGQERDWRYQISNKWGNQQQTSGGGFKGAVEGVFAGASMGANMAQGFGGMGGGASPAQASPVGQTAMGSGSGLNSYGTNRMMF